MKFSFTTKLLDSLGFSASFLCALHCASLPLILTAISASSFSFLANPFFEVSMILVSVLIGLSSLLPSYKNHKNIVPIASLLIGFSFIFSGHFVVPDYLESIVTPIGAFIVAFSHLINIKYSKDMGHSCSTTC